MVPNGAQKHIISTPTTSPKATWLTPVIEGKIKCIKIWQFFCEKIWRVSCLGVGESEKSPNDAKHLGLRLQHPRIPRLPLQSQDVVHERWITLQRLRWGAFFGSDRVEMVNEHLLFQNKLLNGGRNSTVRNSSRGRVCRFADQKVPCAFCFGGVCLMGKKLRNAFDAS